MNNGRLAVPAHQLAMFKCPQCGWPTFEVLSAVRFMIDRLDPEKMVAKPHPAYRCLGCNGWLVRSKDGAFTVESAEPKEPWQESAD